MIEEPEVMLPENEQQMKSPAEQIVAFCEAKLGYHALPDRSAVQHELPSGAEEARHVADRLRSSNRQ